MQISCPKRTVKAEGSERVVAYGRVESFEGLPGQCPSAFVSDRYRDYYRYRKACPEIIAVFYGVLRQSLIQLLDSRKGSFDVEGIKASLDKKQVHSCPDK